MFERSIAMQSKDNPKKFWSYVRSKTKTKSDIPELKIPGSNNKASSDGEKAQILADYFSSVFTLEPAREVPKLDIEAPDQLLSTLDITVELVAKKL